ncbi:MAG: GNAT family N-acetyltransferase [Planctomycetota bacterium]
MGLVIRDVTDGDAVAAAMATAAGPHGVYVRNALAGAEGAAFVMGRGGPPEALVWVGPRGNLVAIVEPAAEAALAGPLVDEIARRGLAWRIAMGPAVLLAGLRDRLARAPLSHRTQVYCVGDAASAAVYRRHAGVRRAQRADRDRLMQATLLLNQSDLNVDPARVDRRWLRDTIDERIADGTTRVIGPPGAVECTLDLGSDGPGGLVVEGVFTFPEHRGRGLAAALVASVLAEARGSVCLHVGERNLPARRAYATAGMAETARCTLLLTA